MLRVIKENVSGLKYPLYASLTLSFASFGDAFLYPFLPQYADTMKIPVVWIGALLSINRFIRIVFNPLVIKLFACYGVRFVTITGSVMAIVSTIGYGLGWGLFSLIVFRIIWGMAFAILRISAMAYAFGHAYIGLSLGVGKSIQDAGPMLALLLGPALLNYFPVNATFILLALISFPSLLYSFFLPDLEYIPVANNKTTIGLPSLFNAITFCSSFIAEGVLIIVAGLFLSINNISLTSWTITSLAAGYLAYRRICSILFAPVSGVIADRTGFTRVFNFSILMIIVGLIFLIAGLVAAGLIIVFTFNSINSTMAPGEASNAKTDKIKAAAINATWRDAGAAAGTLIGGMLLSGSFLFETFTITTFILSILLLFHLQKNNKY